jgi:hypothetical protein
VKFASDVTEQKLQAHCAGQIEAICQVAAASAACAAKAASIGLAA